MGITAAEQYGIELLNRARLNPAAEAAWAGISLNKGIGDIDPVLGGIQKIANTSKQALAPSQAIDTAASRHSTWMLDVDKFSHIGAGGTNPGERMAKAGYSGVWAENITYRDHGTSTEATINQQHMSLMQSASHRQALMTGYFQEIGYSQVNGQFNGTRGSMLTQNFGVQSGQAFITGVAYVDSVKNNDFYNIGEGRGGIRFSIEEGRSVTTAAAGGYGLKVAQNSTVTVLLGTDGEFGSVTIRVGYGNVKLDLVDRDTLFIAGNATLGGGIDDVKLLGINNNTIEGNDAANHIRGNAGNNKILGDNGADSLYGGDGHDTLLGGNDNDHLFGGAGNDRLNGGPGQDIVTGGLGADTFVFVASARNGRITDFNVAQNDKIELDRALFANSQITAAEVMDYVDISSGTVIFTFGNGHILTLTGVSNTAGLADHIVFF